MVTTAVPSPRTLRETVARIKSDEHDLLASSERDCAECGARLAHDQRYCVACGARRGPLPPAVAGMVAGVLERGQDSDRPRVEPAEPSGSPQAGPWFPTPRVGAIAVLGMLAFAVAVGSSVDSGVASLSSAPLLIVAQRHAAATVPTGSSAPVDSSGAANSSTQTVQTITVTSTAPQPQTSASSTSTSTTTSTTSTSSSTNALGLPPVKHVFLIVLSGRGYGQTFAPGSPDTYLSKTLPAKGEVLPNYYAVTPGPLANEIALISGQGPTPETAADCPVFAKLLPGTAGRDGQALGAGCVYPPRTKTLADQLTAAGLRWKAYLQGLPPGARNGCVHPAIGAPDSQPPTLTDPYATWRNPFVYFRSLTGGSACADNEAELSQLALDLQKPSTTPAFSYIVADACNDGSDTSCDPTTPSGPAASDAFLQSVLPEIEQSAAYKAGGMIAITFDQAPQTGQYADPSSCCANPTFPNLPSPSSSTTTTTPTTTSPGPPPATPSPGAPATTTTPAPTTTQTSTTQTTSTATTTTTDTTSSFSTTPTTSSTQSSTTPTASAADASDTGQTSPTGGGGQVGMLLLSPYVKPGSVDLTSYFNHFSLLKSVEALFGLKYLGYAASIDVAVFDSAVFTNSG
jgi:hypothetical protein